MNMPGFTAEQGLRQHQHAGDYLLRSMEWPVGSAGEVRPQLKLTFGVCRVISGRVLHCCVTNSDEDCCKVYHKCEEIFSDPI